ncbi:hypothetical protein ACFFIS_15170 [Virgibacillus soli]|uniref:DUF4025 domain-containing protein n=1 Tax=Paracerasibacillus soli TaxID=480284 RepID=A0ABU5CV35_9BACI|nr:hypothetical protein [Virgibacillus soli]MDY0410235.1 hypothetical protein [Virgibacillus soli]
MERSKRRFHQNEDMIAPGMNTDDKLDMDASDTEKQAGETTKVTKLIYDEYDPSEK